MSSYPVTFAMLPLLLWAGTGLGSGPSPVDVLHEANAQLRRTVLDNGMILLVKEDHSAPVVAVEIWVGTGSIHEQEFLGGGLSHYLEHMVFKGTPTRGPGEVSKTIDGAGGDINAYTGFDRTVFHTTMPARHWKTAVDVLSDAVLNASLPEDEWKREREVVLREVAMGRDDPNRVISKLLFQTTYHEHPYRIPVIGYEDVLTKMTREQLMTFHRRHYVTDNLILVVVGDVSAAEIESHIRDTLGVVERRARAPVVVPAEPPQLAARQARKTGAYNVTRMEFAYHTVPLSHPDTPALDVLAQVAGRGRSSRLVKALKEDRQLVHSVKAWSYTPLDPGFFAVSTTLDPSQETAVLPAVEEQIASFKEVSFSEEELAKARRQILVSELAQLQTVRGQASSFASGEFYAGDARYAETYLEELSKVTPADLQRVARTYLREANRSLAVLAPAVTDPEAEAVVAGPLAGAVHKLTLKNGVIVLIREDHRIPFVYFAAALKGGLLSETAADNGVSRLAANLLTRGTPSRSAEDIAEQVETLGGTFSPYSGRNSFGLTARCLTGDEDVFMDLITDCLLHSICPETELEKERTLQLAAIDQARERPFFLADEIFADILYPDHPYRWDELGTPETVGSLTSDAIRDHLAELVVGSNLVLSVFGDITIERARELAEQHLAALPKRAAPTFRHPLPAPVLPAEADQRAPKEQTILLVGVPGVTVNDPRVDALELLQNALSGLSSDLVVDIRDKRGLVYYAGAFQRPGLEPGCFAFYAGTQEESLDEVRGLIEKEIERVTRDGLREEELERSRAQLVARHDKSLQNNGGLAQMCALNELYGLGYDHAFATAVRLEALTIEDVREAAASILKPERMAVAVLLPEQPEDTKEATP